MLRVVFVDLATVGPRIDLSNIVLDPSLAFHPRILPGCLDRGCELRADFEPILNISPNTYAESV